MLLNLMIIFNGMAQNQEKIEGNWQGTFQLRLRGWDKLPGHL